MSECNPDVQSEDVRAILRDNLFENPDVGDLNAAMETDVWVVSIPKCSTTSIQYGLQRLGHRVIHAHTNPSTHEAFANGHVLADAGIGIEDILKARLETSSRRLHFFFGYREPVAWWVSLAGQFALDYEAIAANHPHEMSGQTHPWNKYSIEDMELIARKAFGVDLRAEPFDHERGLRVIEQDGFTIVLYRADRMEAVEGYIQAEIAPRFEMSRDRVNLDPRYLAFKDGFTPSADVVARLYEDPWFRYFFTAVERQARLAAL
ncbi:hypothetical protein [Brevundimonas subvibrioides]|uniref:Sulfotransferase family protein n=1 Tax=Brevundimonas subvibrioides (strain ATCC 15264 / DSM 4735 / LMG 14903 / NBRC 16000 / CB 81) TaxID=633149 RepID=D9QG56_BRESC|nr:hypothetical protein [Brevundimonas subvibrioides]ADL02598.1 hypothetical protein Bresu_3292 [Brevundimonas subvibrioides ATCC 15264]